MQIARTLPALRWMLVNDGYGCGYTSRNMLQAGRSGSHVMSRFNGKQSLDLEPTVDEQFPQHSTS